MGIKVVGSPSDLAALGIDIAPLGVETLNGSEDIFGLKHYHQLPQVSTDKGTIAELQVAILLLRNNFEPYMPLQGKSGGRIDMLAVHKATGKVVRIHVRSGHINDPKVYAYSGKNIIAEVRFLEVTREADGGK